MSNKLIKIPDINSFTGAIPHGHDLVIYEQSEPEKVEQDGLILYGFDEVGDNDSNFTSPAYGFLAY